MYYIYGRSGPSLLIESTDSMILPHYPGIQITLKSYNLDFCSYFYLDIDCPIHDHFMGIATKGGGDGLKFSFEHVGNCKRRKRKMETESGNGRRKRKRKVGKGKGRHCNTYNVMVQAS